MTIDTSPLTAALQAIKDSVSETEGQNKSPPTHTPGPYAYHRHSVTTQDGKIGIATCKSDDEAEFIARACNSHYELLEIIEAILNRARAAIAKMRGQ
jgi:hypothetical protein